MRKPTLLLSQIINHLHSDAILHLEKPIFSSLDSCGQPDISLYQTGECDAS